jgi:hypothetical protein
VIEVLWNLTAGQWALGILGLLMVGMQGLVFWAGIVASERPREPEMTRDRGEGGA